MRSFAELAGEIRVTSDGMLITLDPPDLPLHRRALRGLCVDLTQFGTTCPGTDLPILYAVAGNKFLVDAPRHLVHGPVDELLINDWLGQGLPGDSENRRA